MKRKRYTEEQIIGIVKVHEAGMPVQDVIRKHGIANGTFYRWKSKFGGMEVSEAKRLREFETENAKLKKLLAETMLDKTALEDVLQKSGEAGAAARSRVVPAVGLLDEPATCLSAGVVEPQSGGLSGAAEQGRCVDRTPEGTGRAVSPVRLLDASRNAEE